MVTKHLKFRKNIFIFVFRYRYEKPDSMYQFVWNKDEWKVGFWYKKQQSRKNNSKTEFINDYMFGFEFFVIKTWIKVIKDYYA